MTDLQWALLTDAMVLGICIWALVLRGRLSAFHPGTTYLFFHAYTVTLRLLALELGARPMWSLPEPVHLEEIYGGPHCQDHFLAAIS
jgi:uncharacterized paraquat-inducible protein A